MASKVIAAGPTVETVYVKSETAMCWITVTKILLILKASFWIVAIKIRVSPISDDRTLKKV